MKFYDRTTELQVLEKNWHQSADRSMMTTLIGRRRIGKTALLLKSVENKPFLYLYVSKDNEQVLCRKFQQQAQDALDLQLYGQVENFGSLFKELMKYGETHHYTLIIDEFQNLLGINAAIPSEIQDINFLPFGEANENNRRIKPYTPYIFVGLGAGVYNGVKEGTMSASGYVPVGIGFKWKFHERVGLNIAWQHNLYFSDDLEGQSSLSDRHQLNGSNWMNCDVTGMLTAGIVFEFARAKKACKICNW